MQALLLLYLNWVTSPNRTELGHMAASLWLYETGKADMFHVNPPLLRMIVGAGVTWAIAPQTDWTDYSSDPTKRTEWATGVAFVRANDWETVRLCYFLARTLCIPFILLGTVFGYLLACELFGRLSGFIFLTLWIFSPLILGWGATICPDVTAAALGIVAVSQLRRWLLSPTWRRVLGTGFTLGLLPLAKLTWVVALVGWPLLWLLANVMHTRLSGRERMKQGCMLLTILFIAVAVINAGFLADGSFKRLGDYSFRSELLTNGESLNRFTSSQFGAIPIPFPEQFVLGFDTQQIDFERGMTSYLFGKNSEQGWWYYYFVVLVLKETPGTLILLAVALFLFLYSSFRASWRDELILAMPLVCLFAVVSVQTGFSLHSRYIIPALPFLYIWISRVGIRRDPSSENLSREAVDVEEESVTGSDLAHCGIHGIFGIQRLVIRPVSSRLWTGVIVTICLAGVISSLWSYPYSMSYLNETVRTQVPPPLLGSNIDWGQDLYELKTWLEDHPEARPVRVAMSNILPLEMLGIISAGAPPQWTPGQEKIGTWSDQIHIGPQPGWFLLGANDLFDPARGYTWLWRVPPRKRIGFSTYIFYLTLEEINQLREQEDLPPLIEEDLDPGER